MDVLGDLVARDRRSERTAFYDASTDRSLSYHDFCTTAYKAGNVLRYLGVREGSAVSVRGEVGRQPLWAFYGAGQLGAVTQFVGANDEGAAPRVRLVPVETEAEYEAEPGTKLATYGGAPTDPTTLHWEKELWSENPAVHPTDVNADDPLLGDGTRTYSHADVLGAARTVVESFALDESSRVAVRGLLRDPHVVVAGLVAPILAGGTVVAPGATEEGDVAVLGRGTETAPEDESCLADDVPL